MDLANTVVPKSDQLNADDLLIGPRTFTIEKVTGGTSEQPVNIHLAEAPGKPYRPSKSMRRVLIAAWGAESDAFIGQKLTLFRDPKVKFGGIAVGGIVISHMTGIDKPLKVSLTVTKGKKALATIEPLIDTPPQPDPIEQSLRDAWNDVDRLQKAVKWMADNQHPLHEKAASRLAELQETGEVAEP